jgi:enoyl-CoA hydratase/carnithine racemase
MAYQLITYERRDAVAVVTLNRPEKLNAGRRRWPSNRRTRS